MFGVFVILIILFSIALTILRNWRTLPPGPWGFPLLGHLPLLGEHPAGTILKWKKIYGPLLRLRLGCTPVFIFSDAKVIREAFNHHAFEGRHQLQFITDVSKGKGIVMAENEKNEEQRQFTFKVLRDFGLGRGTMEIKIQEEITRLFKRFDQQGGHWMSGKGLYRVSAINWLWEVFFSETFDQGDAQVIQLAELITIRLTKLENYFEKLTYFLPTVGKFFGKISGYDNRVAGIQAIYDFMGDKIDQRRATLWVKGQPENFTDAYLDRMTGTMDKNSSFHPNNLNHTYTTGDLFIAAIEAVGATLDWLTVYLSKCPHVQRKLQSEIDQEIGYSCLPSLKDRPQMKYAEAVVTEILRISTVTPLGAPRRTLADVTFMGYDIPKGTMIMGNQYAVNHDDETWEDPFEFRPERFLPGPQGEAPRNKKTDVFSFGNGGRSCVGESLAKDQLFLFLTSLVQRYNIFMDPEEARQVKTVYGITLNPSAFRVKFQPRNSIVHL